MSALLEHIMNEGRVIEIMFSTTDASTVEKEFVLATSDYDVEGNGVADTTPFAGKMLFITGMRAIVDVGVTLEYIKVDNWLINKPLNRVIATALDVFFDGAQTIDTTTGNVPKLKDLYGVEFIPCRWKLAVKASVSTTSVGADLITRGILVDNVY